MKKINKIALVSIIFCIGMTLSGCDMISDAMGSSVSYDELSNAVISPKNASDIEGKEIEFSAYVLSDVYTSDFGEEDKLNGQKYIMVAIARNKDKYIEVNVESIKEIPAKGTYTKIKGKVNGYVYGVVDNSQIEYLHIIASSAKEHKVKEEKDIPNESYTDFKGTKFDFKNSAIEIKQDSFDGSVAVIYYDVKIADDSVVSDSSLMSFFVYQGDTLLNPTHATSLEGIDSTALEGGIGKLNKGEKGHVYDTYDGLTDTTTPISIMAYDDDFNVVFYKEIQPK